MTLFFYLIFYRISADEIEEFHEMNELRFSHFKKECLLYKDKILEPEGFELKRVSSDKGEDQVRWNSGREMKSTGWNFFHFRASSGVLLL